MRCLKYPHKNGLVVLLEEYPNTMYDQQHQTVCIKCQHWPPSLSTFASRDLPSRKWTNRSTFTDGSHFSNWLESWKICNGLKIHTFCKSAFCFHTTITYTLVPSGFRTYKIWTTSIVTLSGQPHVVPKMGVEISRMRRCTTRKAWSTTMTSMKCAYVVKHVLLLC